jgi:predicted MFS family arabinose efflux permease
MVKSTSEDPTEKITKVTPQGAGSCSNQCSRLESAPTEARGQRGDEGCEWILIEHAPFLSFAGGFVVQSFAAYWFYLRFGVDPGTLGVIFFWANVFAGISVLLASRLATRFGLINTMVITHLPSNILLILVPLMPNLSLTVRVLLMRFSISQMDVPTRQSYTMAVVSAEERSAAAGITGVARTTGAAISPLFVGLMFARLSLINAPFFIAGTLKIVYDLSLYREFVGLRPPEETS